MPNYVLHSPTGKIITGTSETLPGVALIGQIAPAKGGGFSFEYSGDTEVHWNGQKTDRDSNNEELFVDEDGCTWPRSQLTVVEEADGAEEEEPASPQDEARAPHADAGICDALAPHGVGTLDGGCLALATVAAAVLAGSVGCLLWNAAPDGPQSCWVVDHYYAVLPDGRCLDGRGFHASCDALALSWRAERPTGHLQPTRLSEVPADAAALDEAQPFTECHEALEVALRAWLALHTAA